MLQSTLVSSDLRGPPWPGLAFARLGVGQTIHQVVSEVPCPDCAWQQADLRVRTLQLHEAQQMFHPCQESVQVFTTCVTSRHLLIILRLQHQI